MEDCKSLTDFIIKVGVELASLESLLDPGERFEEAQSKIDKINLLIAEKNELFRWRSFEKVLDQPFEITEDEYNRIYPGFWPLEVSPDGKYLAYNTARNFTIMNLESGEENKLNSNMTTLLYLTYFKVDPDPSGGVFIRGAEKEASGIITEQLYATNKKNKILQSTYHPPLVFSNYNSLASYDHGQLSRHDPSGTREDFSSLGYSGDDPGKEFVSIEADYLEKFAITLNGNKELNYWSIEQKEYMGVIGRGVLDYVVLPGELNFIILTQDKLFHYQYTKGKQNEPGRFKTKVLKRGVSFLEYTRIAKSPDGKYLFAIAPWSKKLEVFELENMESITITNLSNLLSDFQLERFECGSDNSLVFGGVKRTKTDRILMGSYLYQTEKNKARVIILKPKWGEND